MKFTKNDIVKETANAISFNISNQNLWFQKKRILTSDDGNNFEITQNVIDDAKKSLEEFKSKPEQKITISTNETVEDYNDKVFKLMITLEVQDEEKKEFSKPCFVSKKFVSEKDIDDNNITLPLWFWNKIEEDIISDSVKYSNEKFSSNLSNRDYKILNETKIIE
jgi:hypothetical protein